ncbi:MAG: diguanylate cyclase [Planctomycetaceae bacterium]|nr:diguanylate cyclase [Planctomycetaceae bacterium]
MLGNRLRMLIESSYIIHKNEKLQVTISIGATLVNKNDTVDSIVKRADTLLYKSKAGGKNCVTIG